MAKKYAIYNDTVKPARLDKSGRDTRKAIERVGHGVSFRDSTNNPIIVQPRQNPRIVDTLTEGMIQAARAGLIRIEEVDNVVTALRQHTLKAPVQHEPAPAPREQPRRANVTEMGAPADESSISAEYPGAVNPDGEPNFRVTAPHGKKAKRARATEMFEASQGTVEPESESAPAPEGESSEG